jgi:hypothetical protein
MMVLVLCISDINKEVERRTLVHPSFCPFYYVSTLCSFFPDQRMQQQESEITPLWGSPNFDLDLQNLSNEFSIFLNLPNSAILL